VSGPLNIDYISQPDGAPKKSGRSTAVNVISLICSLLMGFVILIGIIANLLIKHWIGAATLGIFFLFCFYHAVRLIRLLIRGK
jgi:hypothetical protein